MKQNKKTKKLRAWASLSLNIDLAELRCLESTIILVIYAMSLYDLIIYTHISIIYVSVDGHFG